MAKEYKIFEEQILIRTELPLLFVQKFMILHQMNEHGILQLWAEVSEEKEEVILYRDWSNTDILIYREEEERKSAAYNRGKRNWSNKGIGSGEEKSVISKAGYDL